MNFLRSVTATLLNRLARVNPVRSRRMLSSGAGGRVPFSADFFMRQVKFAQRIADAAAAAANTLVLGVQ